MPSLPNSEVYIWLHWSDQGKKVAKEICDLFGFEPSEKTVHQEMCDIRWKTKDFDSAVKLTERLRSYINSPEIILIRATGKVAGELEIITLKDNRKKR